MKTLNKTAQIIGGAVGLFILVATLYFSRIDIQAIPPANNIDKLVIGQSISSSNWLLLNPSSKLQADSLERIYVVVSPSCPHCRHILSILNSDKSYLNKKIPIFPVFRKKANMTEINKLIELDKINYPIFKIREKSVLDSIKLVPSFIYTKNGNVQNIVIGGVADKEEFNLLVNSIVKTKWKPNIKSQQESACLH
ncbi:hypothetical protein [Flectobacillus major]|uniref:hypothetical protein n=1 Tax=Flectobacillus major TaxID=103 RepID=UPI000404B15B|nr:hypothetical protein [Flectobacillus major]